MPTAEEPIRHSGAAPGDSVTTENSSIGTLHTTRQCGIPSADLLGRAQLKCSSFLVRKLSNETDCFFSDIAVSLKSKRPKIERLQTPASGAVEYWVF